MSSSGIFHSLPAIYVLPTHLTADEQLGVEDELAELSGRLTYDAKEARIFLGRISQKKRANFDLRARGLWTEEISQNIEEPARKRQKLSPTEKISPSDDSGTESEVRSKHSGLSRAKIDAPISSSPIAEQGGHSKHAMFPEFGDEIVVLNLDWLNQCTKQRSLVPFDPYIIYKAKAIPKPQGEQSPEPLPEARTYIKTGQAVSTQTRTTTSLTKQPGTLTTILDRAKADVSSVAERANPPPHPWRRRFNQASSPALTHPSKPPKLYRTTTSEFENLDSRALPELPSWVRENSLYACRRSTPLHPPNSAFLAQLYKIKEARLLTLDEIGVRAYATSIASIAAYPHVLQSGSEVLRLPGCEQKVAALFAEWYGSADTDAERYLAAVRSLEADDDLKHLKLFFEIWGVGAETARKFYYDKGWRDIDDVVEYGWSTLNRVQQIGVKFYDEFQVKIPRGEVEAISATILRHARLCRWIPEEDWETEDDMVAVIVGGYRRGKEECGDVDLILSHRKQEFTKDLVIDVVQSLETEGWITHTLTLNTTTSDRDQQTLPYRGGGHGHGFDSLDKALCVWQDPHFDQEQHEKNPNIHRRVDIIVSSWRTVGCAVLGWSGATTFERDIRRWVKREKGWKFDSSGVRDRATGLVLDLESPRKEGEGDDWLDREKRLMEGLGIGWREPTERCTG